MRKKILIVFLFFLSISFSKVDLIFQNNYFTLNIGENVINFKVINLEERRKTILLDFFPTVYNKVFCSLNNYFIDLNPFEEKELKIICKVDPEVKEFEYKVKITAKENNTVLSEKYLIFKVEKKYEILLTEYKLGKEVIEPEEENYFLVKVKNIIDGLTNEHFALFTVENSSNIVYSKEFVIPKLVPNQEYILVFRFNFSYLDLPSFYNVSCKIYDRNGNLLFNVYSQLKLKEIRKYEIHRNVSQGIYISTVTIEIKNEGNVEENVEVRERVLSLILNLLEFSEKPEIIGKGWDSELVWNIKVAPLERKIISYKFYFWPIIVAASIILVIVIFLVVLHFTPFIKKIIEKEEKVYKIRLIAKNTSTKTIRNITIKDFVPNIFEIVSFETKKPEIKRVKNGYSLTWNFDKLDPKEEIIVSYKIRPLLEIIGEPKFSKPKMIYIIRDKKSKKTKEARSK